MHLPSKNKRLLLPQNHTGSFCEFLKTNNMLFFDKKRLIHVHCQKSCSKKPPNPTALYPPNSPRMLYYLLQMSGDPGLTKPTSALSDPNFVDNRNVQMNGSAVLPQAYDEFGNAINENMVSHYSLGCFKLF